MTLHLELSVNLEFFLGMSVLDFTSFLFCFLLRSFKAKNDSISTINEAETTINTIPLLFAAL